VKSSSGDAMLGQPRADVTPDRLAWALAAAFVLPLLNWFFGRPDQILVIAAGGSGTSVSGSPLAGHLTFVATFVLLGVLPIALSKPILRKTPLALGLGAGQWREGLAWLAIGLPIALLAGWQGARDPSLAAVYPMGLARPTGDVAGVATAAFALHAGFYLLYYIGFEYHYRGFVLLGLQQRLGSAAANVLQAGIATMAHLGKPPVELFAALPASLLFGLIVLRTRSIWYALAIHFTVGIALDYFLVMGR
jgi:uncharacterized protein